VKLFSDIDRAIANFITDVLPDFLRSDPTIQQFHPSFSDISRSASAALKADESVEEAKEVDYTKNSKDPQIYISDAELAE